MRKTGRRTVRRDNLLCPAQGVLTPQLAVVSETFRRIHATTDLPPITFRDLRHVAATLTHAGGGDIHTVKEVLRHPTIALTSDTYTSLLPELDREVAERAAALVPRNSTAGRAK